MPANFNLEPLINASNPNRTEMYRINPNEIKKFVENKTNRNINTSITSPKSDVKVPTSVKTVEVPVLVMKVISGVDHFFIDECDKFIKSLRRELVNSAPPMCIFKLNFRFMGIRINGFIKKIIKVKNPIKTARVLVEIELKLITDSNDSIPTNSGFPFIRLIT
jgi:hypothetical protein